MSKIVQIFIVSLLLMAYLAESQDIREIQIGELIPQETIRNTPGYLFYKLQIGNNYKPGKDLIIKVLPLDYDSDPDIYISKTNEKPKSGLDSEWQCSYYGKDSCLVDSKNISESDVFHIGIVCISSPCKFSMLTIFTDEIQLDDGVEFYIEMKKEDSRVFKFYIPPIQKGNEDASVTIKASPFSGNTHDFSLYAEIPTSMDDEIQTKRGIPAWKSGQVIRLTRNDPYYWCEDCNITIMLDVEDQGFYHIQAQTNEAIPLLQNGVQVDDVVNYAEMQCYKYYVKNEDTDFQIKVNTYNGKTDVHVNPSSIPEKWDQFLIQREGEHDQIVDIRPYLRRHGANQPKGIYFICVRGELTSTYTLKIHEFYQERGQTTIEDGYQEMFYVREGSMQVHLYQVPPLTYNNEDIKIEVNLVVRQGDKPILAGKMCFEKNPEDCRTNLTQENILANSSGFEFAKDQGQMLQLIIDHNEVDCHAALEDKCYYTFVVINSNSTKGTSYYITATHSQVNHIFIQEGQPYIDSVELGNYKYYKFWVWDDTNLLNVTFQITPFHGDSDLFVSRTNYFPNKTDYEKRSVRIGSLPDHVEYTKSDTDSIATTYFIGIYGYTYATYSLTANIERKNTGTTDQMRKAVLTQLLEGIPFSKTLHNELAMWIGYFDVSIPDNEEQNILINVQNTQGKTNSYIKYGEIGGPTNIDYHIVDGSIKINPQDKAYHKTGTYYIVTIPKFGFFELFTDDYYSFNINWKLENTVTYVNEHTPLDIRTSPNQYSYIKHLVSETNQDIRISLINGGQQDLYVSAKSSNRKPTSENYDFTSKFSRGADYTTGKSLIIPFNELVVKNPSCQDLGYAENESCVLFIGVYCQENGDCVGKLSIQYENKKPKKIQVGQQMHSSIAEQQFQYYYITMRKSQLDDIYAVLTPLSGDLDLYVNLVRDYKDIDTDQLPGPIHYTQVSKQKLKTEMIHITKDDLKKCFLDNSTQSDECIIIFGIFANPLSSSGFQENSQLVYNFIVYRNVIEMKPDSPITGYVQDGHFTYFLYKEECNNCTIIVSLSSYTSGDPDLYIVKGEKLPTLNNYDIRRATIHSEVITLSLDTDFFVNNQITSMEGYYIIGVYGNKNTTFQLSITSQTTPITTIVEGLSIKNKQKAYDISYFQYYHWVNTDIEFQVEVSQGMVELYVNTFNPNSSKQDFVQTLPTSKRNTDGWIVEDINDQNSNLGKELLVMNTDRKYCAYCTYLIAVVTREKQATYNLVVRAINAEKQYTHLLKIGQVKQIKLKSKGEEQTFQFMLENKHDAQVVSTVMVGQVQIYVSFDEGKDNAFATLDNGGTITLTGDRLKTEINYYVTVVSLSDIAELTLSIHQEATIIQLKDGTPQQLTFEDKQDVSKQMIFDLMKGNSTVIVNIKSKSKNFFPVLYAYVYEGQESLNQLMLSRGETNYTIINDWDQEMYIMKHSLQLENLPDDAGLALILVYYMKRNESEPQSKDEKGEVIITISQSRMIKLVPNVEFFGQTKPGKQGFGLFKVEPPEGKGLLVEFSECLGSPQFNLIKNPEDLRTRVYASKTREQGKTFAYYNDIKGVHYLLVEPIDIQTQIDSEYLVKISYVNNFDILQQPKFVPSNGGHIDIEFVKERKGEVKLSWGPLYQMSTYSNAEEATDVRYYVVGSSVSNARLDSVCAIKRQSDVFKQYGEKSDQKYIKIKDIPRGEEMYFNVIAIKDDMQLAFPYTPTTVYIPNKSVYGGRIWLFVILGLFAIFLPLSFYFYFKSKKLQKQLEYEINEVSTSEGGVEKYRKIGGAVEKKSYGEFTDETQ